MAEGGDGKPQIVDLTQERGRDGKLICGDDSSLLFFQLFVLFLEI